MKEAGNDQRHNAYAKPRKILIQAIITGLVSTVAMGVLIAAALGVDLGRDFVMGAVIALVPQLWFIYRAKSFTASGAAALIALAKFGLVTMGFALWFVWQPDANPIATLLGTATAIVVLVAAIKQFDGQNSNLQTLGR